MGKTTPLAYLFILNFQNFIKLESFHVLVKIFKLNYFYD